ncbi:MAG: hypothetical protein Q7S74_04890 [Nanoarchaeota archaeon]|nr:hypothetical protein [Nanoarchaeota archaeon]
MGLMTLLNTDVGVLLSKDLRRVHRIYGAGFSEILEEHEKGRSTLEEYYQEKKSKLLGYLALTLGSPRKMSKNFHEIKWLEREFVHFSGFSDVYPDFFNKTRIEEIEELINEAAVYLNKNAKGSGYDCFVRHNDSLEQFRGVLK